MQRTCIKCTDLLTIGANWTASREKKRHFICKPCFNEYFKARMAYKKARKTDRRYLKLGKTLSRKVTNFLIHSVKRNKDVEYSFEEISNIMKMACVYCGETDGYRGLDRIDSSKGYLIGNVVPCCVPCNVGKSTMSPEQYMDHCKKVYTYNRRSRWGK